MPALCALVFLALNASASAQMMAPPISLTPDQFHAAPVGKAVEIAIRLRSASRSTLSGELLRRIDDSHYALGGRTVSVFLSDDVPFVMGSRADLTPGAVVFVNGVATGHDRADAKKLLIVTKYVKIASK